jgi:hypothetical protein
VGAVDAPSALTADALEGIDMTRCFTALPGRVAAATSSTTCDNACQLQLKALELLKQQSDAAKY